jgi:tetratricopeptide (TPR) repeat protein
MEFYDVLDQVLELLRGRGRMSYRALKRQFHLDDAYIEDLKEEMHAFYRLPLGEAQVLAGRLEEVHSLAERELAFACEHQRRGDQTHALCLLGNIAAQRKPPESGQAEEFYHQALTLAEELGMRPLVAHCHRGLGTLYVKTGQREQARAALSTAVELYRAMEMSFWLPEAKATLAEVR